MRKIKYTHTKTSIQAEAYRSGAVRYVFYTMLGRKNISNDLKEEKKSKSYSSGSLFHKNEHGSMVQAHKVESEQTTRRRDHCPSERQQRHILQKLNIALQHNHLMTIVKPGGGEVTIWARFPATGPGHLAVRVN